MVHGFDFTRCRFDTLKLGRSSDVGIVSVIDGDCHAPPLIVELKAVGWMIDPSRLSAACRLLSAALLSIERQ